MRRILDDLGREDARAIFIEGLLLGSMVGAAIAGSTLWSRWRTGATARRSRRAPEPSSEPGER